MYEVHSWKNYLHHLHRKYDQYDKLFIADDIELHILKRFVIPNDDLVACIHLLDRHPPKSDDDQIDLVRKSIANSKSIKIFEYLYSKYTPSNPNILFRDSCGVFNKKISDFLVNKVDLQSMMREYTKNIPYGLAVFRFYLLHQDDSSLLKLIIDNVESKDIMRFISRTLNDKRCDRDYDWLFKIADYVEAIRPHILYKLISRRLIDVAKLFSSKYCFGTDMEILSNYLLKKKESKWPKSVPDILRAYYDRKLIDVGQLSELYRQMLTFHNFRFIELESYILLTNTLHLSDDSIDKILILLIKGYNDDIIKYIFMNETFKPNKYSLGLVINSGLDPDTTALLFERQCVSYNSIDELISVCVMPEYFLIMSRSNQLNLDQTEKWVYNIISHLNADQEFIDYICKKYPKTNYQKLLEKAIQNFETQDDVDEQTDHVFEMILDTFENNNITLNYERLFNVTRDIRHINIAILLYDRMNN